jgi:hypothetical protein
LEDTSYIKLFRKILKSPIWDNEKMLKVRIWCLLKATHKDREQLVGRQIVFLKKGQFIFGRKKASEELKIKEKTLYDYMQILQSLQMLNINPNNKFSVVTIEKWEDYQIEELKIDNKKTTNEQQMNTNKNVKKLYLYLFNKYEEQVRQAKFYQRMKIIREIKTTKEYQDLSIEEQKALDKELMSIN